MYSEAVEGLLEESIFAESGFSSKAATAVGPSEKARWQRHRVNECEGGVVRGEEEQILPEALLELPEVGCLPGEDGSMYLAEGRKPFSVVTAEEEVDSLVSVDAEELSNHFDSEDLRVGELWSGTALAKAMPFEPVVDKAEDGHDEGAKIHNKKTPPLRPVLLSQHRA